MTLVEMYSKKKEKLELVILTVHLLLY